MLRNLFATRQTDPWSTEPTEPAINNTIGNRYLRRGTYRRTDNPPAYDVPIIETIIRNYEVPGGNTGEAC